MRETFNSFSFEISGYLHEVKESAEVLQLTTFVQSIQAILDALAGAQEVSNNLDLDSVLEVDERAQNALTDHGHT